MDFSASTARDARRGWFRLGRELALRGAHVLRERADHVAEHLVADPERRHLGYSWELADRAWSAMESHVFGFTNLQLDFPLDPSQYASAAATFLPRRPAERYPHMRALTELVIAGAHAGTHRLELLLDGLERLLEETRGGGRGRE